MTINRKEIIMVSKKLNLLLISLIVCVLCFFAFPFQSNATIWTLADGNSTMSVDSGSQSGMYNWNIDGTDQIFQQWFWYRVGNGAEASIDTLPLVNEALISPNILLLTYSDNAISIGVKYVLSGGTAGSGTADVGESISIRNLTSSSKDIHFFQYTDFDLNSTVTDDTVERVNANTMKQTDGSGVVFSEVVATPSANHYQVDLFSEIRDSLNDGTATILNDNPGPVTGDATFAWQWDRVLSGGGSFIISKDKFIGSNPVPEPNSLLLIGSGLIGVYVLFRRKSE